MNKLSTTFNFLAIITIMCPSIINGQDDSLKKSPGQILYACKFTFASAAFASQWNKDKPAQRAAIKTVGTALDLVIFTKTINSSSALSIGKNLGLTFIMNYAAEQTCKKARYYGFSIDALAEKCDILPDGQIRDVVNPITRVVVDTITDIQTLSNLAVIIQSMFSK